MVNWICREGSLDIQYSGRAGSEGSIEGDARCVGGGGGWGWGACSQSYEMRGDPVDMMAGEVMAAWAAAGHLTRIDAAFNQPKVVLYF